MEQVGHPALQILRSPEADHGHVHFIAGTADGDEALGVDAGIGQRSNKFEPARRQHGSKQPLVPVVPCRQQSFHSLRFGI